MENNSNTGRPMHAIWSSSYHRQKNLSTGKYYASCLICRKEIQNTSASRLKMHRNGCKIENLSLQKRKRKRMISRSSTSSSTSNNNKDDPAQNIATVEKVHSQSDPLTDNEVDSSLSEIPLTTSSSKIGGLSSFCDQMDAKELEKVKLLLSKFFFGCNIHFSVVESTHFKNFVNYLRPSFKLPGRKTLSTTYLDLVYKKCIEEATFEQESVMIIDGWKNEMANTKNVSVLLHSSSGKAVFLENWDLSTEKETGEKLNEIIELSKQKALETYNTKIYAVVSDNASNMKKMGKLSDIIHLTCNSHTGQLLARDVLPQQLIGKVVSVMKVFNSPSMENYVISYGGSKISLPSETRWCSHRDVFKCFLNNLPHFKKIVAEKEEVNIAPHTMNILFDIKFIKNVEDTMELLDPICKLINTCQKSTASIACAAEAWLSLQLPDEFEEAQNCLRKRREYALKDELLAANFLHLEYRGKLLNLEQRERVDDYFLLNLDGKGLSELQLYKEGKGIFNVLNEKAGLTPLLYWKLCLTKTAELAKLALKLLSIPASSAQLERIYSNWSYVHNKIRNRLTPEKSKRLVHVYYHLKMEDQLQSGEF